MGGKRSRRGAVASAASSESPPRQCAVCLDALDGPRPTVSLSCTHTFHLDCIGNTWNCAQRSAGEAGKCPMCRKEQPLDWRSGADFQATEQAALERETLELFHSTAADSGRESELSPDDAAYDDVCRACGAGGELLLCEEPECTCAMHIGCAGLSEVPRGDWCCPWCLVARHPQRRRTRSPASAGSPPAVLTQFMPERRSARRRRAERRRALGLSAAVSALRRRRILRNDLTEPASDEEQQRQDLRTATNTRHQNRPHIRRRRCILSSDDEAGSEIGSNIAVHQLSRDEARERAAAAAESRQAAAATNGVTDDCATTEGDEAWGDLTEEEKRTMAASLLCDTASRTLDKTMPPNWHPVDDPAEGALLQREDKVGWMSGTRGPLGVAAHEST